MAKEKSFKLSETDLEKHVAAGIVTKSTLKLSKSEDGKTYESEGTVYQGKNLAGVTALCGGKVDDPSGDTKMTVVALCNKALLSYFRSGINAVLLAKAQGPRKVFESAVDKLISQGVPTFTAATREAKIASMMKDAGI
jgi:hypothetical protein